MEDDTKILTHTLPFTEVNLAIFVLVAFVDQFKEMGDNRRFDLFAERPL